MLQPALSACLTLLLPLATATPLVAQAEEARLMRFPHIQGDRIAFTYGGDIWTASAKGGRATRVTSFDQGFELFPKISPDGQWIAFSGEYTGTRQIYLVPYDGGVPRQLTFYPDVGVLPPRGGYDNLVYDWTPDGKKILITSNRTPYGERNARYFLVDPFEGGLETPLQVPEGGPVSFSPDGKQIAYNIISREWRTWKRYKAGRQQDVFIYDLAHDKVEQITDYPGTDNFPMWVEGRIYFTSDRTGILNLYRYDLATKATKQITQFTDFDVLFPSRGAGGVIFQLGGYLYVMDTANDAVRKLTIQLPDDRPWMRPVWKDGAHDVATFDVSPSAKRAALEFRGELFDAPCEKGEVRNITRTPQRRERDVRWSPDGLRLSYLAEMGEDYELFVRSLADGTERQVTQGTGAWILDQVWSPDSKHIALSDKHNRLSVLDVESGTLTERDRATESAVADIAWSADSGWLSYTKESPNGFATVWLAPREGGAPVQVTSERWSSSDPSFDPAGKYLYFTSARDFDYGELSFNSRLYALLLRRDVASPNAPENDQEDALAPKKDKDKDKDKKDEEKPKDDKKKDESAEKKDGDEKKKDDDKSADAKPADDEKKDTDKKKQPEPLKIDLDGLSERVVALPGDPGSYSSLEGVDGALLFVRGGDLMRYDLEKRKTEEVLKGTSDFRLTPDGKKVLYRHGGDLCLASTSPKQTAGDDKLPLTGVRVRVVPQEEWAQIYIDAWRIMRDWFYDPKMHGVDWRAMRDKYQPLIAHVAHRSDLDFVLGELIGELNAGHCYVLPGETPHVDRVPVGVLGCELAADSGRYRITKIFQGRSWRDDARSPITEAGVDAKVGDYLISIDGDELTARDNPYQHLENKVGAQVELLLNDKPSRDGARKVIVRPAASEVSLRYYDWVERNRKLVDELSGGRIGYVHVPNTGVDGHRELFEDFRPLARVKEAMLIDERYNGGGFIPDRMIAALALHTLNYWSTREAELGTTPSFSFDGPMAMLINGYSSSGGDAFPYYFRKLGLGLLFGKKTWGGLVGYSGTPSEVDGGGLAVPSFAFVNTKGEWDVEAVGVAPDVEVFDDPTLIQAGREPTIEAAVKHLMAELDKRGKQSPRPHVPPGPDRSK